jgi:hypothetical protein
MASEPSPFRGFPLRGEDASGRVPWVHIGCVDAVRADPGSVPNHDVSRDDRIDPESHGPPEGRALGRHPPGSLAQLATSANPAVVPDRPWDG